MKYEIMYILQMISVDFLLYCYMEFCIYFTFMYTIHNQGLLHCRQILYQMSYQRSLYVYIYIYIYIHTYAKFLTAAAKSLHSCLTLCDPMDCSLPGSPVPGILQARTLEWVAISFSNAWKCKVKVKLLSRVWLLVTPWTAAYQAPPSMGFSRQ